MADQLSKPRSLQPAVAILLALQVLGVAWLGDSPIGSVLSHSLQSAAGWLAAAYALTAYRRASGASRHFWLLAGIGFLLSGTVPLGWMYYSEGLGVLVPNLSPLHFLQIIPGAFFAMALLLDEENDSAQLDWPSLLDFVQVVIVVSFLYFELYYIPARVMDSGSAMVRDGVVWSAANILLWLLSIVRLSFTRPNFVRVDAPGLDSVSPLPARSSQLRSLYWGMACFLAVLALSSVIRTDYHERPSPRGRP